MLRQWQKAGTAAGLSLVLYDNRDRDHSNMHYGKFPQLTRIEYAKAAREKNLDHGLQRWFRFNYPTIGNSSTATTSGVYWRSNPRLAMGNRNAMKLAYLHYVTNHLYFYPEHRDHDPGHNGKGGHGDVFPANTPYFVISQGSSGSDRVFMDAVAATIAAFRPKTQKRLRENGVLMPTVQMIFRRANKMVKSDDDYLDGRAHPTVFTKQQLNVKRMVELAHEMKADQVPAMVQLRVLKESEPKPGVNIFVPPASEKILDTPAAIARVHHTTDYARRMRVSAAKSRDVNGHKLKFAWRLLRGDPDKVRIKPVKPDRSIVDLQIAWHERRPIRPGAKMASNRVDIGVFVHNGYHWSAPGFISITFPDDEDRTYTDNHRIASITYKPKSKGGNYVDPMIVPARHWRDEYLYTDDGKLRGWKRSIGGKQQRYTRHGALMTRADDHGRPVRAVGVTYQIKRSKAKARPRVTPKATKNAISYDYASDRDQLGEVAQ